MTETKRWDEAWRRCWDPFPREQAEASGALRDLPIAHVRPNPFQPRTRIDEGALTELDGIHRGLWAAAAHRGASPRDGYELIAGERRWRAVERLGWTTIPAVVKDVDDQTLLTLALIENLQRNDLSPIDEAPGIGAWGTSSSLPRPKLRGW